MSDRPTLRPTPLRPTLALLIAGLAAACCAGCGSDRVVVTPVRPAPPQVLATLPVARASGVVYDTPIAVDFATDMDAATLTTSNVFLKLDTQRIPISLNWNAPARRLQLIPQVPLQLRRTYTVELTEGVRTTDGAGLPPGGWFFQFTTNSVRRPADARPRAGVAGESPFVMLSWDSTEAAAGNITYEVWSGLDSTAIAVRAGTPTGTSTRAHWLPSTGWPLGARVYWAVTVVNATTGERFPGPVLGFETVAAGTAVDSILVRAQDYGYNYMVFGQNLSPFQICATDSVVSQNGTQGWMVFPLSGLSADVRIASVRLEVHTFPHYVARLATTNMLLWSSRRDWLRPCRSSYQFRENLPAQDQLIATGRQESDRRLIFMSDLLASHVEASVRRGGFFGYEFLSSQRLAYVTPRLGIPALDPYLKIHYFRTDPAPVSSNSP